MAGQLRNRKRGAWLSSFSVRRETVEHPFGTMKARMGATHFLTAALPKVAAEMALFSSGLQTEAGHEHCRHQAVDGCNRGLRQTRLLAARLDIPWAVFTRVRRETGSRWCKSTTMKE
jgi:hypothetical protein